MRFLIDEEEENTVVLQLQKVQGDVEVVAKDGNKTSVLFVIKKNGAFARVEFVSIPYFKLDEEGRIEEEEL